MTPRTQHDHHGDHQGRAPWADAARAPARRGVRAAAICVALAAGLLACGPERAPAPPVSAAAPAEAGQGPTRRHPGLRHLRGTALTADRPMAMLVYPWLPHTGVDRELCGALAAAPAQAPEADPVWPVREAADPARIGAIFAADPGADPGAACAAAMRAYDLSAAERFRALADGLLAEAGRGRAPRDAPLLISVAPGGCGAPVRTVVAALDLEVSAAATARAVAAFRRAVSACEAPPPRAEAAVVVIAP